MEKKKEEKSLGKHHVLTVISSCITATSRMFYFCLQMIRSAVRLSAPRMPKTPLEKILPGPWLCTVWIRQFEGLSTGNRTWSWIYTPNIPGRLYIWKADCWLSLQCSSRADCCAWCVVWDLFHLKDCTQQTGDVPIPWGICKCWRLVSNILKIIIHYRKCDGADAN